MRAKLVNEERGTLAPDDEHPYRTGPWQPNMQEYDVTEPEVIGEIPADLNGIYIRNT
ncbi:MAG: apocarotenoid-15,15'-oxygenase, partial [Gammaproteobacteria bacterium]|nr:apocarotenoid-15,15'-oxygenase [Gammaproteobacteria bacterium]